MKKMLPIRILLLSALLSLAGAACAVAQDKPTPVRVADAAEFDRVLYDFGDVMLSDGPLKTTFHVKNIGKEAMVIYNVASSCGCTDVDWTRNPLRPGETGTISATYSNDEGAFPFDKTLTVYLSVQKQPVILRFRGISHAKKLSLAETYPVRFGPIGFREAEISGGNLSQGETKSGEVTVANLGAKPVRLTFKDVSDGLSLRLSSETIPVKGTVKLYYTVTADRSRWGRNYYYATPLADGRSYAAVVRPVAQEKVQAGAEAVRTDPNPLLGAGHAQIGIRAVTKENFSGWSKEQVEKASRPLLDDSTVSFGRVKKGTKTTCTFNLRNAGKSSLTLYKVDTDSNSCTVRSVPSLAPGARGTLEVDVDTSKLPEGETLILLNLYTNSPHRPLITLFVTGWVG